MGDARVVVSRPEARILFGWDATGRETARQPVSTGLGSGSQVIGLSGDRAVVLESHLGDAFPERSCRSSRFVRGRWLRTEAKLLPAPEIQYGFRGFARVDHFESEGSIQVSFRRAGPTTGPATVGWRTRDRSAKSGSDFLGKVTGGRVDFLLEVEKQVSIPIVADAEAEGVEFFDISRSRMRRVSPRWAHRCVCGWENCDSRSWG